MPAESANILSPLKLIDHQLLKSSFKFIPPISEIRNLDPQLIFSEYKIELDYAIQERDNNEILFFMKSAINYKQDDQKIGYSLFAEIVSVFNTKMVFESLEEDEAKQLILFSSISISVNNLRNHLYTLTINAPFKGYMLPALDIQEIVKQKQTRLDNTK